MSDVIKEEELVSFSSKLYLVSMYSYVFLAR